MNNRRGWMHKMVLFVSPEKHIIPHTSAGNEEGSASEEIKMGLIRTLYKSEEEGFGKVMEVGGSKESPGVS